MGVVEEVEGSEEVGIEKKVGETGGRRWEGDRGRGRRRRRK